MSAPAVYWRRAEDAVFLRRPAVPVAVVYLLGVLAHRVLPHQPFLWMWLLISGALITFVLAIRLRRRLRFRALWLPVIFLLGLTIAQFHDFYYPRGHIGAYATDEPTPTELRLRIDTPPRLLGSNAPFRPLPPRQMTGASVLQIKRGAEWIPANGKLLVMIDQPHPRLALGEVVRVIGLLQRPMPAMNPGQFDYAAYYREQRVLASLTIKKANDIQIERQGWVSPLDRLREGARRTLARGFAADRSLDHALLRALLLGDSDPQMRDVQEQFARSGTAYELAVSGMHVAILGGFVFLLCRLLCCPPRTSVMVMMLFVLLYGIVALPAAPILRAVFLCLSFGLGSLLRRPCDKVQLLALAVLAMLLCRPLDVYSAGFQLSFLTVLGMMVFARPVLALCNLPWDVDDRIAMQFQHPSPRQRAWIAIRRHAVASLSFAAIAWLVSAPLIAYHFDSLNPFALLAGLLMLPLVILALVGGMLKILLTLLLPGFSGAWAAMSVFPVALMRHAVALLAQVPGSHVSVPRLSIGIILLYYAMLCIPLLPTVRPRVRRCLRAAPALGFMMVLLPLLVGVAPARSAERPLRVTLLAIGAGQVGVIELPGGRVVLIDDGSSTFTDPVRSCLTPYLRQAGYRSVSRIFLSHPDFDHVSGTVETVEQWGVHEVDLHPLFRAQSRGNAPAEAMLESLDAEHLPIHTLGRGDHVRLDDATNLDVVWPPPNRTFKTTNEAGLVLRLTCRGRSILFPADIQQQTERELMADAATIKSDVLIAPHHGSAETTTAAFVAAVRPQIILSSNDRTLSLKQRKFDQIVTGTPLYRTNRCGAVSVTVAPDGKLGVETFLPPAAQLPDVVRWKR